MKRDPIKTWTSVMFVTAMAVFLLPGLGFAGNGERYLDEGTVFLKQAKLQQAVEALSKAIILEPDRVEAYNNRGLAYYEQNRFSEARRDFLKAIELAPNDEEANNNLGVFFCGLKDYDRALHYFRRSVKSVSVPSAYDAVVYRNLAFVYTKKGLKDEAADAAARATSMECVKNMSPTPDQRRYGQDMGNYTLTLKFSGEHAR